MTAMLYNSPSAIRKFLDEKGLGMRKKYGQNFLVNPGIRQKLFSALEAKAGESVWEVGPGIGAMTGMMLEKGLKVRAFEIDPGFNRVLREIFQLNNDLVLVEGDVLKTWPSQPPADYLLGNLPYNIAAALLAELIIQGRFFKRMAVTVQREVAQRMASSCGRPDYSLLSVICASAYHVKPLMFIKSASFYPRPNVDSQGLLLELKNVPALPACFFQLVKHLFSSRRKTVKNNLSAYLSAKQINASGMEILRQCGINGGKRAEELTLEDFILLAKTVENMDNGKVG